MVHLRCSRQASINSIFPLGHDAFSAALRGGVFSIKLAVA